MLSIFHTILGTTNWNLSGLDPKLTIPDPDPANYFGSNWNHNTAHLTQYLFPVLFLFTENDVENADPLNGAPGVRTRKVIFQAQLTFQFCKAIGTVGTGTIE